MLFNNKLLNHALNNPKLQFINNSIEKINNIKILELGVREGISTSMFLNLCEKNNGKLLSVDIHDYGKLFQNQKWKFIHSRDDNFELINTEISKMGGLDVLYIDSFHEPNHVKKLFYNYYKLLNKNGFIFVDDICWLPYAKLSYRENSWVHEMNLKTFEKLLEIKYNNDEKINIEFSFNQSGTAKIIKLNDDVLNEPKKIKKAKPIRNLLQNFYNKLFNKY